MSIVPVPSRQLGYLGDETSAPIPIDYIPAHPWDPTTDPTLHPWHNFATEHPYVADRMADWYHAHGIYGRGDTPTGMNGLGADPTTHPWHRFAANHPHVAARMAARLHARGIYGRQDPTQPPDMSTWLGMQGLGDSTECLQYDDAGNCLDSIDIGTVMGSPGGSFNVDPGMTTSGCAGGAYMVGGACFDPTNPNNSLVLPNGQTIQGGASLPAGSSWASLVAQAIGTAGQVAKVAVLPSGYSIAPSGAVTFGGLSLPSNILPVLLIAVAGIAVLMLTEQR